MHLNLLVIHGQNLKWRDLLVYGNYGVPIGSTHYGQSDFADNQAALFSNMKYSFSLGADLTVGNSSRWGYGLSIKYGSLGNWTNIRSTRFKESKVTTLDIGPLITFDFNTKNSNRISRLIFSPTLTNLILVNPNDNYNITVNSSNEGTNVLEIINVPETFQKKNIWAPGIYLGEESTFFLNERYLVFIRLGLKSNYVASNAFPDKFLINPSIAVGCGIKINREKWFFLK